jgi:hypothetical protein
MSNGARWHDPENAQDTTTMASKAVEKKNEALKVIDELFGDTSVPNTTTLDLLEELQSEIDSKIEALKSDIKNKKE